jgi:two-component system sensor histidine kinase MprB
MSAVIVGVILVLGSLVAYAAVRNQQLGQIDDALRGNAAFYQRVAARFGGGPPPSGQPADTPPPNLGGPGAYVQVVGPNGRAYDLGPTGGLPLPVTPKALKVANGRSDGGFDQVRIEGVHLRVLTAPLGGLGAVQVARSLADADRVMHRLRIVLFALVVVGTALAAVASRLFSKRVVAPVTQLTEAAEHIEVTGDLGRRIDAGGDDEVGRMATHFNAMLARLQASQDQQRQLVADASHELRTPVTTLLGNVEYAARHGASAEVLQELVSDAERLARLVDDLLVLERAGSVGSGFGEVVDVAGVVREVVARYDGRVAVSLGSGAVVVRGDAGELARAVENLIENALVHGPTDGAVTVSVVVSDRRVLLSVRDSGPGPDPGDVDRVFERFWRGPDASARPGSGLGLSIVAAIAERHGGAVSVEGSAFTLDLPALHNHERPDSHIGLTER